MKDKTQTRRTKSKKKNKCKTKETKILREGKNSKFLEQNLRKIAKIATFLFKFLTQFLQRFVVLIFLFPFTLSPCYPLIRKDRYLLNCQRVIWPDVASQNTSLFVEAVITISLFVSFLVFFVSLDRDRRSRL